MLIPFKILYCPCVCSHCPALVGPWLFFLRRSGVAERLRKAGQPAVISDSVRSTGRTREPGMPARNMARAIPGLEGLLRSGWSATPTTD